MMHFTLIFIYTVGFGNQAVNTEKFTSLRECETALTHIKTGLGKDLKFSVCSFE